jgi:trans-2,3-dihydro-3-hydroxyanthranilate isomerase
MRKYRFFTCDVFTNSRFGGNQLAVLPEADGLSREQMQQIATEFNYSESTFVTASNGPDERNVRIFTPTTEVPFAGHPNIGTAFALASDGAFGDLGSSKMVRFHEAAGTVSISIDRDDQGRLRCELEAPQSLTIGSPVEIDRAASALSLDDDGILSTTHPPIVAGVGLPFLVVELVSMSALERAKPNIPVLEALHDDGIVPDIHLYVRSNDEFDIHARMFAPLDGVLEDPATGSANCALVALLTERDPEFSNGGAWRIAQGVEMGRPSTLEARTARQDGKIRTWIGGNCVSVAEGQITVD